MASWDPWEPDTSHSHLTMSVVTQPEIMAAWLTSELWPSHAPRMRKLSIFVTLAVTPGLWWPSVWEIGWLSSSYRAQWTPIVTASGELWSVMMSYDAPRQSQITHRQIQAYLTRLTQEHGGNLSGKMEHMIRGFNLKCRKTNTKLNQYWWFNYFLPFSLAQRAHIARWS